MEHLSTGAQPAAPCLKREKLCFLHEQNAQSSFQDICLAEDPHLVGDRRPVPGLARAAARHRTPDVRPPQALVARACAVADVAAVEPPQAAGSGAKGSPHCRQPLLGPTTEQGHVVHPEIGAHLYHRPRLVVDLAHVCSTGGVGPGCCAAMHDGHDGLRCV